jgi:hypothetical protein
MERVCLPGRRVPLLLTPGRRRPSTTDGLRAFNVSQQKTRLALKIYLPWAAIGVLLHSSAATRPPSKRQHSRYGCEEITRREVILCCRCAWAIASFQNWTTFVGEFFRSRL